MTTTTLSTTSPPTQQQPPPVCPGCNAQLAFQQCLCGTHVYSDGQPLFILDAAETEQQAPDSEAATPKRARALMCNPCNPEMGAPPPVIHCDPLDIVDGIVQEGISGADGPCILPLPNAEDEPDWGQPPMGDAHRTSRAAANAAANAAASADDRSSDDPNGPGSRPSDQDDSGNDSDDNRCSRHRIRRSTHQHNTYLHAPLVRIVFKGQSTALMAFLLVQFLCVCAAMAVPHMSLRLPLLVLTIGEQPIRSWSARIAATWLMCAISTWQIMNWMMHDSARRAARASIRWVARRTRTIVRATATLLMFAAIARVTGAHAMTYPQAASISRRLQSPLVPASVSNSTMAMLHARNQAFGEVSLPMQLSPNGKASLLPRCTHEAIATCVYEVGATRLPPGCSNYYLVDSAAGTFVARSPKDAIPGSISPNNIVVSTANGKITPPLKCSMNIRCRHRSGAITTQRADDCLIMDGCDQRLIPAGVFARDTGIGIWIAPGQSQSYMMHPQHPDDPIDLVNTGVLVLPDPGLVAYKTVTHGLNAGNVRGMTAKRLHNRYLHASNDAIKRLINQSGDKPFKFKTLLSGQPQACDACLRGTCKQIGPPDAPSTSNVTQVGDQVGYDIWSVSVPHMNTGKRYVAAFVDRFSGFDKVYLMRNKSDIPEVLDKYLTWAYATSGKKVKQLHTDNEMRSGEIEAVLRKHGAIQTTISPDTPRQNSICERQWSTHGDRARRTRCQTQLPPSFWWYFFKNSVEVGNYFPTKSRPESTPYFDFTGVRPNIGNVRPIGCLAYVKVWNPASKMHEQGERSVYLGTPEDQLGYMFYSPVTNKVRVSVMADFVEDEFPNLAHTSSGEIVQPSFTSDLDAGVPHVIVQQPDLTDPETVLAHDDSDIQAPAPPTVGAIPRGGQGNRLPRANSAQNKDLQEIDHPVLQADVQPAAPFVLYLGSGARRNDDFETQMASSHNGSTGIAVKSFDKKIGGHAHDWSKPSVLKAILALAAMPSCLGMMASVPCNTWSAVRFNNLESSPSGASGPLRDIDNLRGFESMGGQLPTKVIEANALLDGAIAAADAVAAHGGVFVFEHPVPRGEGSDFAMPGREKHASMFDDPAMKALIQRHGATHTDFDLCRVGAMHVKTTRLCSSPTIAPHVAQLFGHLTCNCPGGHAPMRGLDAGGQFVTKSSESEKFTPELNRLLTTAWKRMASTFPRRNGWIEATYAASGALPREEGDTLADDWSHPPQQMLYSAVTNASAALPPPSASRLFATGLDDDQLFVMPAVARDDNPSHKQTLTGPEASKWEAARCEEMDNFERAHVFRTPLTPEDKLTTWDKVKRRAFEVIDSMFVYLRKYNKAGEISRYKARCVVLGNQQKSKHAILSDGHSLLDTFAPAIRNSTFKMLLAASVVAKIPKRVRSFDVTAAYLNGTQPEDVKVYVRPPPGQRTYTPEGIPLVWDMAKSCYGEADAGRTWFLTLVDQLTNKQHFVQSEYDPCYFFKVLPNGRRIDLGIYVDDGWTFDDCPDACDAELRELSERFGVTDGDPTYFLGMNVTFHSPKRVTITSESYIDRVLAKSMPGVESCKPKALPCDDALANHVEVARKASLCESYVRDEALVKQYGTLVGKLLYVMPTAHPEIAFCVSKLSQALTFPDTRLMQHATDLAIFLIQHKSEGITFDGSTPRADELHGFSDSDWSDTHSTTGFCILYGGAVVVYASGRQKCIAMSSTEAEIIAASKCAMELAWCVGLFTDMGRSVSLPVKLHVDNSGAVALAKDRKSCNKSRHIDRRYFKVRELVAQGTVAVEWISTDLNTADVLTKALSKDAFHRHSDAMRNSNDASKWIMKSKADEPTSASAKRVTISLPEDDLLDQYLLK